MRSVLIAAAVIGLLFSSQGLAQDGKKGKPATLSTSTAKAAADNASTTTSDPVSYALPNGQSSVIPHLSTGGDLADARDVVLPRGTSAISRLAARRPPKRGNSRRPATRPARRPEVVRNVELAAGLLVRPVQRRLLAPLVQRIAQLPLPLEPNAQAVGHPQRHAGVVPLTGAG